MPRNQTDSRIENLVQQFAQELQVLIRQSTLEALQGALGGVGGVAMPRRRGRPAGGARRGRPAGAGRRGRRPSAEVEAAGSKIVSHVRSHDGEGVIEIAKGTGIPLKVVKKAALRLLGSGELKKSGIRRGTVYHVGSGRAPAVSKAVKRSKRKAGKRGKRRARKASANKPGAAATSAA